MLDVARKAYKEFTMEIISLGEELSNEYNIVLEIKYEHGRGFYFRHPVVDLVENPLPPVFVNVIRRKKYMELGTIELCKRNKKVSIILLRGSAPIRRDHGLCCRTMILGKWLVIKAPATNRPCVGQ